MPSVTLSFCSSIYWTQTRVIQSSQKHLKEHQVPHSLAEDLLPCISLKTQRLEKNRGAHWARSFHSVLFDSTPSSDSDLLQSTWESRCYVGIRYHFLISGVQKENIGSWHKFPNVDERKPFPRCPYILFQGQAFLPWCSSAGFKTPMWNHHKGSVQGPQEEEQSV